MCEEVILLESQMEESFAKFIDSIVMNALVANRYLHLKCVNINGCINTKSYFEGILNACLLALKFVFNSFNYYVQG